MPKPTAGIFAEVFRVKVRLRAMVAGFDAEVYPESSIAVGILAFDKKLGLFLSIVKSMMLMFLFSMTGGTNCWVRRVEEKKDSVAVVGRCVLFSGNAH